MFDQRDDPSELTPLILRTISPTQATGSNTWSSHPYDSAPSASSCPSDTASSIVFWTPKGGSATIIDKNLFRTARLRGADRSNRAKWYKYSTSADRTLYKAQRTAQVNAESSSRDQVTAEEIGSLANDAFEQPKPNKPEEFRAVRVDDKTIDALEELETRFKTTVGSTSAAPKGFFILGTNEQDPKTWDRPQTTISTVRTFTQPHLNSAEYEQTTQDLNDMARSAEGCLPRSTDTGSLYGATRSLYEMHGAKYPELSIMVAPTSTLDQVPAFYH